MICFILLFRILSTPNTKSTPRPTWDPTPQPTKRTTPKPTLKPTPKPRIPNPTARPTWDTPNPTPKPTAWSDGGNDSGCSDSKGACD